MDYEKAFKEAYERASLRFGTNVANELFLEYKESKEERIRRKLIEFFSDWSKTKSHCWGIRVTDIMDWLEKQGTSYTKRDVDDAFVECMAFAKDELEKQKPTWSKKDEEIVTGIINDIQERLEDYPIEQLADIYFKEIKWLKSLKNRIKEE